MPTAHRAVALRTDVAYFVEQSEPEPIDANQQDYRRRLGELIGIVLRITNPQYRQAVCALAKVLADRAGTDQDEG